MLLVRRRFRWALPGGTIRTGETALQCAHRELGEETSLEVSRMTYLWQFGGLSKRHRVFLTELDGTANARAQNEIRACRWFEVFETDSLLLSVPTRAILQLALTQCRGHARSPGTHGALPEHANRRTDRATAGGADEMESQ